MYVLHLDLGAGLRGGQRQVFYLARGLTLRASRTGVATGVACPSGSPLAKACNEAGIEVIPLPGRRPWSPLVFLRVLLAAKGASILHAHDAQAALLAALLKPFLPGVVLVNTRRVSYPLGRGLSRWKYLVAALNVGVSHEIAAGMAEAGIPPSALAVAPSAVDPTRYAPRPEGGAQPGLLTLGAIGALTPQKGHEVFLDALALIKEQLNAQGRSWRALLVGDGPLRAELEDRSERLGLADKLEFLGYRDSAEILPQLDVLASCSVDGEGSSGVVREAWVTGVPLVVSDLAANLEMARNGENCLTFRSGDARDLAATLLRLISSPELSDGIVAGGRERAKAYTDQAMVETYLGLYQTLPPSAASSSR
jgi:glycosyltransferase involved in cell wall biosynthesis